MKKLKREKGKDEEVMMGCHEIEEHGGNHTGLESFLMGLLCFSVSLFFEASVFLYIILTNCVIHSSSSSFFLYFFCF